MKQKAAHDAVHGGRRADTQREGDDSYRRPALLPPQRAQREGEVLSQIGQVFGSLHALFSVARGIQQPRLGFSQWAEAANGFVQRFIGRGPIGHELPRRGARDAA